MKRRTDGVGGGQERKVGRRSGWREKSRCGRRRGKFEKVLKGRVDVEAVGKGDSKRAEPRGFGRKFMSLSRGGDDSTRK